MEDTYRTSRIPREGTYFQRLQREITNLISLYDYDCNFDVTFEKKFGTVDDGSFYFRFRGFPHTITIEMEHYNKVELQTTFGIPDDHIFTTDPKHIVRNWLQSVQSGAMTFLFIGDPRRIVFDAVDQPHNFDMRTGHGDITISDIPLCKQLISAFLKMYPPG